MAPVSGHGLGSTRWYWWSWWVIMCFLGGIGRLVIQTHRPGCRLLLVLGCIVGIVRGML